MILIMLLFMLLVLVLVGIPVILAIGLVGLAGFAIIPDLPMALMPQRSFAMLDSFSLLAMPYFILAGAIMAKGGLAGRLVAFAELLVGHIRGNLGLTTVTSCTIMANVSGSSVAEAAAVGSIVIPEMKKRGYRPGHASAITAAAATIGPIIPPSMTMIVYGSMAGVSIGGLFMAGIIPGLMIAGAFMLLIYLWSFIPGTPGITGTSERPPFAAVLVAVRKEWAVLLSPVIILGGILAGIFTATEAGIVACVYALFVSMFLYKTMTLKDMGGVMIEAAVAASMTVGIIALAGPLGWMLSYLNFSQIFLAALQSISTNGTVIFLLIIGVTMFLTMFIEGLSVLIVIIPVTSYCAQVYSFDPMALGLALVISTQVGALTPPVAVLQFVTTAIARCTLMETTRHLWPFILILVGMQVLLVFFPGLASFLPALLMGGG